jgi:hypothetical protein
MIKKLYYIMIEYQKMSQNDFFNAGRVSRRGSNSSSASGQSDIGHRHRSCSPSRFYPKDKSYKKKDKCCDKKLKCCKKKLHCIEDKLRCAESKLRCTEERPDSVKNLSVALKTNLDVVKNLNVNHVIHAVHITHAIHATPATHAVTNRSVWIDY